MIKILAVDDEPGICDILRQMFKAIGFTVLTATGGSEALNVVRAEKPGIVFLDVRMLGMSGFEVLKEIKKIDPKIKVNMVTVLDDEKSRIEAKGLGADEYIIKPFQSNLLEELVRRQVSEILDSHSG